MTNLTRRQILIGGGALAASGLIPAIPRTVRRQTNGTDVGFI
jgi:hypothetical protein